MAKNVRLKLSNLFLDLGNPRYEEQGSQLEALNTIASYQGDKLLALLKDIIEHGLNPSEMLIVAPMPEREGGKGGPSKHYVVLEGNRRVAAMKLLRNPGILRDEKLKAKYNKLHEKYKDRVPKQIDCVVLKPEVASLWIERKHEGELGGIGTVQWDPVQKTRFQSKNAGKDTKILQVIDFMNAAGAKDIEFLEQVRNIDSSSLKRLLGTPEVREYLGIGLDNGAYTAYYEPDELMKGLRAVVKRMSDKDFKVKKIYTKKDRLTFIHGFSSDELPDKSKRYENTWPLTEFQSQQGKTAGTVKDKNDGDKNNNQNENKSQNQPGGGAAGEQRPTTRETLIPADLTLTIPNERINRLFVEMKDLVLNESPNICSVTLRIFVEWSMDAFLEAYDVKREKQLNPKLNRSMREKFTDVVEKMKTLHCIHPDHLKGMETAFSEDRESIFSFHTLNAYVHNNTFNPMPSDIMYSWDNAEPFIKAIWKAVNDKLNNSKQQ